MWSSVIREKLNRGLGMTIGYTIDSTFSDGPDSLLALKTKISGPEAGGGLTDTMQDRALIVAALKQALQSLQAQGLTEEIRLIYVDFVGGDPTRFNYAQIFGFKKGLSESKGVKVHKLLVLGKVVKNYFGGGFRWQGPGAKVLTRINDRRAMEAQVTAALAEDIRNNADEFRNRDALLAAMLEEANQ